MANQQRAEIFALPVKFALVSLRLCVRFSIFLAAAPQV